MKILGTRVFRNLESEGRGNERVLEFGVEAGKKFSNRCNSIKIYEV